MMEAVWLDNLIQGSVKFTDKYENVYFLNFKNDKFNKFQKFSINFKEGVVFNGVYEQLME